MFYVKSNEVYYIFKQYIKPVKYNDYEYVMYSWYIYINRNDLQTKFM